MATHSSVLIWRVPWIESLAGYSPWGCKELDITEQLTLSHFFSVSSLAFLLIELPNICVQVFV